MDYSCLPFVRWTDTVTDATRQEHYDRHADILNQQRKDILRTFQTDRFRVSGITQIMPEFLVSSTARESLIYPQGFLILDAASDYFTDRGNLPSYELRYTLSGEGMLEYNGKKYTLSKGEGYWIDCRNHHYYETVGDHWCCTVFHFNGVPACPIFSAFAQSGNVKFTDRTFPGFELMQMQILQETQKVSAHAEFRISCLFHMLLTELLVTHSQNSASEKTSTVVENIIRYMQANYKENFSVEDLCRTFGISRTHLNRCFRQYTGFSPHDYLIQIRLNAAKLMLQNTNLSVDEICSQSGFQDTAYFIQIFKKREGITPLKFRKIS